MDPFFPPNRPDSNDITHFQNQQAQDFQMQQMQQQIDQQRFENQQLRSRQIPTRIYIGRNPLMVKMANEHPIAYLLFQIVRFSGTNGMGRYFRSFRTDVSCFI